MGSLFSSETEVIPNEKCVDGSEHVFFFRNAKHLHATGLCVKCEKRLWREEIASNPNEHVHLYDEDGFCIATRSTSNGASIGDAICGFSPALAGRAFGEVNPLSTVKLRTRTVASSS